MFAWKRPQINEKEEGMAHFLKKLAATTHLG